MELGVKLRDHLDLRHLLYRMWFIYSSSGGWKPVTTCLCVCWRVVQSSII